ncbi:microsomal glutathione S-transferase 1-like [Eupeodes corollae]|uniref:microsomal glutathione S-transferase 1-like n=1 Tax=Eupeodes corollae TaxID=290404 RepID=UPI002493A861|nr:microsomal glutathione S-transferase 1-like [Eupeodes corollae]
MSASELISFGNPVFQTFAFWGGALALKMLAMSILTAMQRLKTKTFPNPEDAVLNKVKVKFDDPDVERVRRAHRNDMENIFVFFLVGLLYVLTNPSSFLANNLFRAVGIGRIVHTVVYVMAVPQPARGLAWFIPYLATGYMALQVMISAL